MEEHNIRMKNIFNKINKKILNEQNIEDIEDINYRNKDGNTALMLAIIDNKLKVVIKILRDYYGVVDINIKNNDGNTALMLAIINNRFLSYLQLEDNPNIYVNIKNNDGNTALMLAIINNNMRMCYNLLERPDIDVNIKNNDGNTALDYACVKKLEKVITIIFKILGIDCINKNLKEFIDCINTFIRKKSNKNVNNIKNDKDVCIIVIEYLKKNYNLQFETSKNKIEEVIPAIRGKALLSIKSIFSSKPSLFLEKIKIQYMRVHKKPDGGIILKPEGGINYNGITKNFFYECQEELNKLFKNFIFNKPNNRINRINSVITNRPSSINLTLTEIEKYYIELQISRNNKTDVNWNNYIFVVNLLFCSKINNCPIYLDTEIFYDLSKIVLNLIIIDESYSLIQKIFIVNMLLKYKDIVNKKLYYGMYDLLLTNRHRSNINNTAKYDKKNVIATYISEINETQKINRNTKNKNNMNKQIYEFKQREEQDNINLIASLLNNAISIGIYKDIVDFYYTHFIPHIVTFKTFMQNLIFDNSSENPPINKDIFITNIKKLLEYMNEKDDKNILLLAQTMTGNTLVSQYKINMYSTLVDNTSKAKPASFHTCFNSVDFYEDNFPFIITSNNEVKNNEVLDNFIHLLKTQINSEFIA
jgi:hypothetical protein